MTCSELMPYWPPPVIAQTALHTPIKTLRGAACMLQGTIRDNIAFGVEDATDEEVTQAAEAANAMLFIKKAPAGFRTQARPSCHSGVSILC